MPFNAIIAIIATLVTAGCIVGWLKTQYSGFRFVGRISAVAAIAFTVLHGMTYVPVTVQEAPPPPKVAPKPKPPVKPRPPAPAPVTYRYITVPTNQAGFIVSSEGINDCNTVLLPGIHKVRKKDTVYLVDTSVEVVEYRAGDANTADNTVEAVSKDGRVTNVEVEVPWSIVPENVPIYKCTVGGLYSPHVSRIIRPAVREVLARKSWSDGSILDRAALRAEIHANIERYATEYFAKLGIPAEKASMILRLGVVDVIGITHQT